MPCKSQSNCRKRILLRLFLDVCLLSLMVVRLSVWILVKYFRSPPSSNTPVSLEVNCSHDARMSCSVTWKCDCHYINTSEKTQKQFELQKVLATLGRLFFNSSFSVFFIAKFTFCAVLRVIEMQLICPPSFISFYFIFFFTQPLTCSTLLLSLAEQWAFKPWFPWIPTSQSGKRLWTACKPLGQ